MKLILISTLSLLVGVGLGLITGLHVAHRYEFHVSSDSTAIYRCDTITGKVSLGSLKLDKWINLP